MLNNKIKWNIKILSKLVHKLILLWIYNKVKIYNPIKINLNNNIKFNNNPILVLV
jgi:hypothetical protein